MWRLFQSLLGGDTAAGNYSESLVKEAIERAVDGTDPWIRAVSGYKKKLRPAVLRAIDHVVALVDGMPPPLELSIENYADGDPLLRRFFISTEELRDFIATERNLAAFRKGPEGASPRVVAMLAMEKQERGIIGVALSGDVVMRDVPQTTVSFEGHRLMDPSGSEEETRRRLMRRAYDHLLSLALGRIATIKTERVNLERYRTLLQSKLNLLQRGGWGFDSADSPESMDEAKFEELLGRIDTQLMEVGGDDRQLEVYLDIVADVLGRPEEHLWSTKTTLIVDRLGIRRGEPADDAPELTLDELCNAEGQRLIVSLVTLPDTRQQGND